jgi:hypothetical protein
MRRDNGFDAKAIAVCDFEIVGDLKLRIDDRSAALAASTQKVGCAARVRFENLSKDHSEAPITGEVDVRRWVSRIRRATIAPDPSVSAATTPIAVS